MLIDYEYRSGNLILSLIKPEGNIYLKYYPWPRPTKFIITSDDDPEKSGRYVKWDGKAVKEIYTKYPNRYAVYDFIDALPEEEKEEIFSYREPMIFFIDIENQILDKKPEAHLAEAAILTISIVNKDKILVLGFDPLSSEQIESIESDINNEYGNKFDKKWKFKYVRYKNEYELLLNFFKVFVPKMAVLTGWNFVDYDWVYLVSRARKIGVDPTFASLTRKLRESYQLKDHSEMPAHRIVVDYMNLYKKIDTSIKVKESAALDFVADKVLGVKKVNYEGNLKILYEKDFKKFVYYNAVDSLLVQLIHQKMRWLDIIYGISVMSRITLAETISKNSNFSTLAVTEGILREKLRKKRNVVLCKDDSASSSEYSSREGDVSGGFVLHPIRGMAEWTAGYDFASLYPRTMIQFNISPDSYKGQKVKNKEYSIFNHHHIKLEPDDIVLNNGAVFKNEIGVVTEVMTEIYDERKRYKKMMMEAHEILETKKEELAKLEMEFK